MSLWARRSLLLSTRKARVLARVDVGAAPLAPRPSPETAGTEPMSVWGAKIRAVSHRLLPISSDQRGGRAREDPGRRRDGRARCRCSYIAQLEGRLALNPRARRQAGIVVVATGAERTAGGCRTAAERERLLVPPTKSPRPRDCSTRGHHPSSSTRSRRKRSRDASGNRPLLSMAPLALPVFSSDRGDAAWTSPPYARGIRPPVLR